MYKPESVLGNETNKFSEILRWKQIAKSQLFDWDLASVDE